MCLGVQLNTRVYAITQEPWFNPGTKDKEGKKYTTLGQSLL